MNDKTIKEYLEFAKEIATEAGEIMLKYFYETDKSEEYKKDETVVTKADKEINSYLIEKVKEKYPSHAVYGEEKQYSIGENHEYVWVCDPVDGTAMYARNVPVACFSLALVLNGNPIVGVVNDPFTKSMYWAIKGKGAYKNGIKINVNNFEIEDKKTYINAEMWKNAKINLYKLKSDLKDRVCMTNIGSVVRACMLVATGDYAAEIFPAFGKNHYDVAASKVIVEEAGGIVTNIYGEKQKYDGEIQGAILSNKKIHKELVGLIKNI